MADDSKKGISEISRRRNDLIRKRQEVQQEMKALESELHSKQNSAPLEQLNSLLDQEIERQKALRNEIEQNKAALRALLNEKRTFAQTRDEMSEKIKQAKEKRRKLQSVANDKDRAESERNQAASSMRGIDKEIEGYSIDRSVAVTEAARRQTAITGTVGFVEQDERDLSRSRRASRAIKSETRSREQNYNRLDKLQGSDQSLSADLQDYDKQQKAKMANAATRMGSKDTDLEGLRARDAIRQGGGGRGDAAEAKSIAQEMAQLHNAIRDTKKALSELTEGTEEYAQHQSELNELEGKEASSKERLQRLENDVEKRQRSQADGGGAAGAIKGGMGALAGLFGMGSSVVGALGAPASQRYVREEERKQSQLLNQNMSLTDTRMRATDATAYLATGGASRLGAETPYDNQGRMSGRIQKLGQDYADTRETAIQYNWGLERAGDMANVLGSTAAGALQGAGAGGSTPWGAAAGAIGGGAGAFLKEGTGAMVRGTTSFFGTPEVAGRMGGTSMARGATNFIEGTGQALGEFGGDALSNMVEKGGGNGAKMKSGAQGAAHGFTEMAAATPKLMQRGYEDVEQLNQLLSSQQQGAQAQRVRERLQMAFAPAQQQYMDLLPTQLQAIRGTNMNRGERRGAERGLESFSLDQDLVDRGFDTNQIVGNAASSAQMMGRFGTGGRSNGVAKASMEAEAMGLGSAQSSMQSMGRMLSGGVKDPEAMFKKAVQEGLQRGIQDSREFQGLLQAAESTADSTASYEGALEGVLKASGSGRAGDVLTAQAAYQGAKEDMSGFTGGWTDMVKFDVTNQAAKNVISKGDKAGVKLDREDKTSLQNLANLSTDELKNKEVVSSMLTPQALKAVEASGGLDQFTGDVSRKLSVHGMMDRAINSTQSQDLVKVRDMIANGDKEGLKKMFSGPDGQEKLKKVLALTRSGMTSTGNTNRAMGAGQDITNELSSAMGMDQKTFNSLYQNYDKKDAKTAYDESRLGSSAAEGQRKGIADISSVERSRGLAINTDKNGNSTYNEQQQKSGEMYRDQSKKMDNTVKNMETADPKVQAERLDKAIGEIVKGLEEMKESFKGFKPEKLIANVAGDVIVQGAGAIKGVIMDNAVSQTVSKIGSEIGAAINNHLPGSSSNQSDKGKGAPGGGKTAPTNHVQ